jgi:alkanesulfonate monooxygenase SsuD/methylene tetrahydromethanopterin reductase-like flavin-dependent oxidoreductase (luciferase family)
VAGLPALAVTLPQFRSDARGTIEALEHSYHLGYSGGFLFDHLWPLGQPDRPALECWTTLAALAGRLSTLAAEAEDGMGRGTDERAEAVGTGPGADPGRASQPSQASRPASAEDLERFRLGTLVTRAGLRSSALLAHMARTVGSVIGAPPIVGIGTGDAGNRPENEAFGIAYHVDPTKRGAELLRAIDALRGPLGGTPAPPVWVGGTSHRAHGLAGRVADGWNGWGLHPDELAAGIAEVRRAAEDSGRDPVAVEPSWGGQVLVAEDAAEARAMLERWGADRAPDELARVLAGDGESVVRRLVELGDAGAVWCVLAFVGGPALRIRTLLAAASELSIRRSAASRSNQ